MVQVELSPRRVDMCEFVCSPLFIRMILHLQFLSCRRKGRPFNVDSWMGVNNWRWFRKWHEADRYTHSPLFAVSQIRGVARRLKNKSLGPFDALGRQNGSTSRTGLGFISHDVQGVLLQSALQPLWVWACPTNVEYSQQEGFYRLLLPAARQTPPTWRTNSRHKVSPASWNDTNEPQ